MRIEHDECQQVWLDGECGGCGLEEERGVLRCVHARQIWWFHNGSIEIKLLRVLVICQKPAIIKYKN